MEVQVSGVTRQISREDVLRATFRGEPQAVVPGTHYVVLRRRRWPARQVVRRTLNVTSAEVQTHQAVSILRRLGFTTGQQD